MANELIQNNIEMVICGAIPFYLEKTLINQGCEVHAFIAGEIEQVVKALHLNQLNKPELKMPGCQRRKNRGNNPRCMHAVSHNFLHSTTKEN
jgi:predicted Fe-Mo cluster-binding NifX family protein